MFLLVKYPREINQSFPVSVKGFISKSFLSSKSVSSQSSWEIHSGSMGIASINTGLSSSLLNLHEVGDSFQFSEPFRSVVIRRQATQHFTSVQKPKNSKR